MLNITISFVDCCLPDYFRGHHLPVLQHPVDGATTRKELYNGLLSELNSGVIDYQIEQNGLDYGAIKKAIFDCIYFKAECQDNDIIFPKLEIWAEEEEEEIYPCYAFFVVSWGEHDRYPLCLPLNKGKK